MSATATIPERAADADALTLESPVDVNFSARECLPKSTADPETRTPTDIGTAGKSISPKDEEPGYSTVNQRLKTFAGSTLPPGYRISTSECTLPGFPAARPVGLLAEPPSPIPYLVGLYPNGSLKRSHDQDIQPGLEDNPENAETILVKRPRFTSDNGGEDPRGKETSPVKKSGMNQRQKFELVRAYGKRLVQYHMPSFQKQYSWLRANLVSVGSGIIDGLIEKKFKTLEALHDEFDYKLGSLYYLPTRLILRAELQKLRPAAPDWWRKCEQMSYQAQRMELVLTVFGDVKRGKYDSMF